MNRRSPAWRKYDRDVITFNHIEDGILAEKNGDITSAIDAFEKAAIRGSIYACAKLGNIFDDVIKPAQHKSAVHWYKAGVRLGDSACAWDLAMHYSGLGNKRWYLHWLQVAQKMGETDAPEELLNRKWWIKHNELR